MRTAMDDDGAEGEQGAAGRAARDALLRWVADVEQGTVVRLAPISGGNRCQSWAIDVEGTDGVVRERYLRYQPPRAPSVEPYTVWREAGIYRVLHGTPVPAPALVAVHPEMQAILTERAPGRADFRRIGDDGQRATIAREFVEGLATLHRLPLDPAVLHDLEAGGTVADCVRAELRTWRAMYAETGRTDPLIDVALEWLEANVPPADGPPALVHGDAGPGNFLFDGGHMTAIIDWELAHPGDPMEDLAWLSMRSVMEPVPDFPGLLAAYGRLAGRPVDAGRIRYHRVFVSTRVVIIRHRNVSGLPGNSIISRALNRRLLVEALADATGLPMPAMPRLSAPATPRTVLFDGVIDDLRTEIAALAAEPRVVAAAKNASKVLKYLRDADRLGGLVVAADMADLADLLGVSPSSQEDGERQLLAAVRAGRIAFDRLVGYFGRSTIRDAALAASASGGLADRHFPPLS
jgi:aminoglycoside phosphotransferase (APT) family kinase protein